MHALAGAIALAAGARLARDRLPPRALRLPRELLDPAPEGGAPGRAGGGAGGWRSASTWAPSRRAWRDERKALDKELKTATQELFGKPRDDAEAVTELLRKGFREELAPLPKATAFDLLDQISRKVPPADKVKLDVAELEIRPKKTFIKGTADTAAAVDEIAAKLKEIDCFEEVTKGAITEVSGGAQAVHPQHHLQVSVSERRS